jgi:hypothetical protein
LKAIYKLKRKKKSILCEGSYDGKLVGEILGE